MESIMQKFFSMDNLGEETEAQKKERESLRDAAIIGGVGTGTIAGSLVGIHGKTAKKIQEKGLKTIDKTSNEMLKDIIKAGSLKELKKKGYVINKETLNKLERNFNINKKALKNALTTTKKLSNRNLLKQTGKGLLIGTGIGAGLGLLSSKAKKKENLKNNRENKE